MFRFKVVGNKVLIMKSKWKKKNEKVNKKKYELIITDI